ncbi:MAG: response regulator [Elusimicrobiales bacterium]|nr:response regulator [Elusimicrobiales bacterium]
MENQKKKIVIIDDEDMLCRLIKLNLESTGRFEVSAATDPRDGIKLVRSVKPDLLLLDLMMPYMEGSEVAEKLLETPDTAKIPIVFLTALADKNQSTSEDGGVAGRTFIAKPVTTGELIRRIDSILAGPPPEYNP